MTSKHELRYDDKGKLDEIVVSNPQLVHFEMMSDRSLWCGITMEDGREIRIWVSSGRGKLTYTAEVDREGV